MASKKQATNDLELLRKELAKLQKSEARFKKAEAALKESEEKYRLLAENAVEVIWTMDLDGNFTYISPSVEHLRGYPQEEAMGMHLAETMTPESFEYAMEELAVYTTMAKEDLPHSRTLELEQLCKDGTTIWTEVTVRMVSDESGNLDALQGTTRDITERRKVQERLRRNEERFRLFYEQAPVAYQSLDKDGFIKEVNKAWQDLLGFEREAVLNLKFEELLRPGFKERFERINQHLIEVGAIQNIELDVIRKDGSILTVSLNGNAAVDEEGSFVQSHLIFFDVTERKHTEREMRKRSLRFDLREGEIYLVNEKGLSLAKEACIDLLGVGFNGLIFTRNPNLNLGDGQGVRAETIWVSARSGRGGVDPGVKGILSIIEALSESRAILLDCMDFLLTRESFPVILQFVQELRDLAYLIHHIVIVKLDGSLLSSQEFDLLAQESEEINTAGMEKVPQELLKILKFVYERNIVSITPTYTDIKVFLGISKPTMGKRIRQLLNRGYLIETKKGREKHLELTEKGKMLFR